MECTTVRNGKPCPFMTAKGCSYTGGICHEVVDQCDGCNRTIQFGSGWYCATFPEPAAKWRKGDCNFATHVTKVETKSAKVNPLKASKRAAR
ncbi:MAG: hypothetical protein DSY89_02660 [Deltaproteobacteria bacterium]|nr:MAG: hypothetical protein DSY89_02660 [Deltaproteobacteria bacterium]